MLILCLVFSTLLAGGLLASENSGSAPTINELIRIKTIRSARISPNGKWIAYSINEADFEQDAYVTQMWLVSTESHESFQLTRNKKSSSNQKWSPDGRWLAFTSRREDKNQIYVISPTGGEAIRLTDSESGVSNYEWSYDGKRIAYLSQTPESEKQKERVKHVGDFFVVRKEYRQAQIWVIDVEEASHGANAGTQITSGDDYHIRDLAWSHGGTRIAFTATVNPDRINFHTANIFVYSFADSSTKAIVSNTGPDSNPKWSPDDRQILFTTYSGKELFYAFNSNFAVTDAGGGPGTLLTEGFDENPRFVDWQNSGIYFSALQRTSSHLFQLNPKTGATTRISFPDELMASSFSLTADGKQMAFTAGSPTELPEIYLTDLSSFSPVKLTDMTAQTEGLRLGRRELISWRSQDDTEIEGVLITPQNFDANQRYPLLCVIHGGPTGIDRPALLAKGTRYYPVDIWADRGALILMVNYRGSAGYGEKFRRLNHRNLGVGDAWDVISGVDHLIAKGWVDPKKVGCMGWSQGGYISAFLTTSSDRFAAISVGAGISNWATYYYNTDITPFTINYLGDEPAADPEIYQKTSPMSYVQKAETPTLIQHGEFDRRVPTPNAYELRQGLEDRGVPVEMVIYKGFGHGINKPKSQRGVMWHNLKWFNHYLWGDPLPNLAQPDILEKGESNKEKT